MRSDGSAGPVWTRGRPHRQRSSLQAATATGDFPFGDVEWQRKCRFFNLYNNLLHHQ
jgi:hypothetical protein